MRRSKLDPTFVKSVEKKLEDYKNSHGDYEGFEYEATTTFKPAIDFLVVVFFKLGIKYKITNIGGGVKYLTTNTDECPLCKRKL